MAALLDRIHAEIRERLEASRGAVEEYQRLEAALAALGDNRTARPASSASPAPAATRRPRRAVKRASRGANREAVLRVVGERPGVGVSELAAASGVGKPVLYGVLTRLAQDGEIIKEQLPSGSAGYRLRSTTAATPSVPADGRGGPG